MAEILKKHTEISSNAVEKAKENIEKMCNNNYGEKVKLIVALSSIVQKVDLSSTLKKLEKEIIKYIENNNEILENNLENIIEELYKKYKEKFDIEYSIYEIKSFLILILMKREEEMYE